jgi:hypothetical protein
LIQGQFSNGAHVFKTKDGGELRGLTVRCRDMMNAITIFKSAHIKFGKA